MLPSRPFLGIESIRCFVTGSWLLTLQCKLQVTIPTLLDVRLKGITTNQTSAMTLDFVAYNGIIDMFFYVKINFDFTTSGYIDKDIKIYPIKLPDLTSSFFPIRLILEIFIIAFTVGRLAKCMRAVYRVALAGIKKGKAGAFGHRLMVVLQAWEFWTRTTIFCWVEGSDETFLGFRQIKKELWKWTAISGWNWMRRPRRWNGSQPRFHPKKIKSPLSHFWGSLFCSFVEVLLFHILQHPFIIFDFLSGISTLVTLVMWYLALFVVFSFLDNNYWIYCLP